ncbi:unnamed protein product [Pleuronectes platessa]|uniref:Uncharacterized protein n=1 Tax=Pleuronectes platessa TaxID=8262 RepID=A0A9N7UH93_PLEPL|nr:unnamed protein product [Pleuronectes platessa]
MNNIKWSPSDDLQKQSTKHLNVSLKNRIRTESHGGDRGRRDGEDGEDTVLLLTASGFSPGGGRRAGGAGGGGMEATPSEEEELDEGGGKKAEGGEDVRRQLNGSWCNERSDGTITGRLNSAAASL